jgi:hypothetical protein
MHQNDELTRENEQMIQISLQDKGKAEPDTRLLEEKENIIAQKDEIINQLEAKIQDLPQDIGSGVTQLQEIDDLKEAIILKDQELEKKQGFMNELYITVNEKKKN